MSSAFALRIRAIWGLLVVLSARAAAFAPAYPNFDVVSNTFAVLRRLKLYRGTPINYLNLSFGV